jgi:hypothetical protein
MATRGRKRGRTTTTATVDGRPRPPFLYEEFALGAPVLPNRVQRRLTDRERRYVLWARTQGYSFRQIAADLNRPLWDVSRLPRKAENDPGIFLDCGFVQRVNAGWRQDDKLFCRLCGEVGTVPGVIADHAWAHLFKDGGGQG